MAPGQDFLSDPDHHIRFLSLPKHSFRLNQVETIFSIIQRCVLRRRNFRSTTELKERRLDFIILDIQGNVRQAVQRKLYRASRGCRLRSAPENLEERVGRQSRGRQRSGVHGILIAICGTTFLQSEREK